MTGEEVLVAIPTFRRPAALDELLTRVLRQAGELGARVLVIDNDPEGSARAVASRPGVEYALEPARGLAAVRNRALDEADEAAALVFIDDDEIPEAGWLRALVDRWRQSGAAAVSGRVETRFPPGWHDRWIEAGGFFRRVRFDDGASQAAAATNNLLLDLAFVRRHGLRFDEAFGMSGGEDILLTKQLVRAGGRIVSCPAALVIDPVDPDRLTRRWVLRRAYRVGISSARTDVHAGGGVVARIRAAAAGAARVTVGSARWLLGAALRSPGHSARGARAAWRGAGMVVGAFGGDYQEYAKRP